MFLNRHPIRPFSAQKRDRARVPVHTPAHHRAKSPAGKIVPTFSFPFARRCSLENPPSKACGKKTQARLVGKMQKNMCLQTHNFVINICIFSVQPIWTLFSSEACLSTVLEHVPQMNSSRKSYYLK